MKNALTAGPQPEVLIDPAHDAGQVQNAQNNQHEAYGKFHGQTHTRGNDQAEENDRRSHQKDGKGVADSPEESDQPGVFQAALAANDGGYRNNVIRVSGVSHAQEEAEKNYRKQGDHIGNLRCIGSEVYLQDPGPYQRPYGDDQAQHGNECR
jgi:hypothetical protein